MKRIVIWVLVPCLVSVLPLLPLHARNSAERDSLRAKSKTLALGQRSVDVMNIDPAATRTAESMMESVRAAYLVPGPSAKTVSVEGNRSVFSGKNWQLEVANDGTAASLYTDAQHSNCQVFDGSRRDEKQLEATARSHITKRLSKLIGLAPDDVLIPYKTRHEFRTFHDVASGANSTDICSSTVTFSRRIGGVDVVGDGSKVQVTIDPDGVLVGWRFDWPSYRSTAVRQDVLDASQVVERASAVGVAWANTGAATNEMECGLYDPGFRTRTRATKIQAGCLVYTKYLGKGEAVTSASINAVPIGVKVFKDDTSFANRYCNRGACVE